MNANYQVQFLSEFGRLFHMGITEFLNNWVFEQLKSGVLKLLFVQYVFGVWCAYEMADEKIICLWNIDENQGYLCWKPLIKQSNHKFSESNLHALLWAHSILAAFVLPDLPHANKA